MKTESAEDIFDSIHSVMHLYRSLQYRALRDGPHELTHMEFKVLAFFTQHPGATQRDLVTRTGRDKAQIARLIKELRGKGLLEGIVDEADKRSTLLNLTEAGIKVYDVVESQGRQLSNLGVEGLSDEEHKLLQTLLRRVQSNLEAQL